jgi:hypothetical protein
MSDPANGHPRDLLSSYLDDELGLEERASVDRHLAGCADCRDELEALRRLARALSEDSVPPVPADLEERIGRRLDAATVVRPRRWRFVVPATVAATLGALGLLVALQWREGRIGVPTAPTPASAPASAPVPESKKQELDKAMPSYAPTPRVLPEELPAPTPMKELAPSDALRKDLAAMPEEKAKLKQDVNAPAAAPAGGTSGVIGGVAGGVEGGAAADELRERPAARVSTEPQAQMQPATAEGAKLLSRSPCAEQWSDSGLRPTWSVQDVAVAVRELSRMAGDVGGIGVWRGVAEGGLYMLVVPRGKFDEVYFALRARGVGGLAAPPAVTPGNDCAGISIVITAAASPAAPLPR